jgi:hypothetical protein
LGGTASDVANSVITDSSGNIVVTGYYSSSPLTIYNADGTTFTTLVKTGSQEGFIVKYNPEGIPLWARQISGTGSKNIKSIKIDSSENIVVTGLYTSNPLTIRVE